MKEINLEDYVNKCKLLTSSGQWLGLYSEENIKKSMMEFGKDLLELAAEKAKINSTEISDGSSGFIFEVDKQSILNTINQVK